MANSTRQEIIRHWQQADKDLDRFLLNMKNINDIFELASEKYDGRYDEFIASCTGFAQIVIKTQEAWRKLRNEKL